MKHQTPKYILLIPLIFISFLSCNTSKKESIKATGIIDGNFVTVKSKVDGTVSNIKNREGQSLEYNELVCKIDSEKILNSIEQQKLLYKENILNNEIHKKR